MIKLLRFSELDRQRWEELLSASPAATFFHTAEWAQLWEESYSFFKSYFLVDVGPGGAYRAGLPFVRARKWLDNYYSMPMGTCGGTVAAGENCELFRNWFGFTRGLKRERLVVFAETRQPGLETLGFRKRTGFSHRLILPSQGRPVYSRSLEKQMGEALEAGFSLVRVEKKDDLDRFFSFSGRGRKKDFYTNLFYEKLAEIFLPSRAAWFLALKEGKTAGYLLGFPFRDELFLWDADFDAAFSEERPGYFLMARVLGWAANKGFAKINFGQTPTGAEAMAAFKERMGGQKYPVFEYTYASPLIRKLRKVWDSVRGRT